jgi:predicted nucleic acid-binding OB-fold protein
MSVGMLSLGATAASAQVSVRVGRGNVEVKVGKESRDNDRRNNDRRDNGRDRDVRQERVWVEDYAMVEERYQEAGHYENREVQVWIAESHVTVSERVYVAEAHVWVTERVLVAESHYTVEEEVYVAGQHVTRQVARRDRHGCVTYVNECVWVPAHYECRQVTKCRPAHYEDKQVKKCVPAHYECRDVVKCVPGHYETVCKRVYVEGCTKTRMVRKCTGGHWETKACR